MNSTVKVERIIHTEEQKISISKSDFTDGVSITAYQNYNKDDILRLHLSNLETEELLKQLSDFHEQMKWDKTEKQLGQI